MSLLPPQSGAPRYPGYSLKNPGEFIHLVLTLCTHIIACYVFIYLLLPSFLLKKKYLSCLLSTFFLSIMMILCTRFIDTVIIPFFKESGTNSTLPFYSSVFTGFLSAIKIIGAAATIRLLKYWWQKQKEKEELDKQRIEAELQLLKAQIHPEFLFGSLNKIYSHIKNGSNEVPEMLIKLSEILSYLLYESDDKMVPLDKELKILKNYLMLEKVRFNNKIEMNMQVKGETASVKIAPLLLLPLVENSITQCKHESDDQPWMNLEILIEYPVFYMKLMNGKPPGKYSREKKENEDSSDLAMTKRRLELLYPEGYQLKIIEEEEIFMVILQLELHAGLEENEKELIKHLYGGLLISD